MFPLCRLLTACSSWSIGLMGSIPCLSCTVEFSRKRNCLFCAFCVGDERIQIVSASRSGLMWWNCRLQATLRSCPNRVWRFAQMQVALHHMTLRQVTNALTDLVCKRSSAGKHCGVILIPEGLIDFIPEVSSLFYMAKKTRPHLNTFGGIVITCCIQRPRPDWCFSKCWFKGYTSFSCTFSFEAHDMFLILRSF